MNWYISVIKDYAVFTGRARRKEYWMFFLFYTIFSIVASILDHAFGTEAVIGRNGAIYLLYALAVFLPSIGVAIRRLHDVGKSGWWLLIILIPFAGVIWFFVLMCIDGNAGENIYGANPKEQPLSV